MEIGFIKQEVTKAARKANLKNCLVLVFGSRVTPANTLGSDLDIALLFRSPPEPGQTAIFREALEESLIPCPIDMVLLNEAAPEFAEAVLKNGIPVYSDLA